MSEDGSDSEDGRESPIFGFSYDEEGNPHSFWAIDPNVEVKSETDGVENGNLASEKISDQPVSPPKSVGFSTASGKPIAISEKALLAAKRKMELEALEDDGTSGRETCQKSTSPPKSVGFSTASGKPIAISEKALLAAKKKMELETLEGDGNSVEKPSSPPKSVGFSTTSGKPISISEKGMLVAKRKMESETLEGDAYLVEKPSQKPTSPSKSVGFSTASGKPITISEKAMLTAKRKMESETFESDSILVENTSQKLKSPPKSVGFSTASGKTISISEKAMLAAKRKMESETYENDCGLEEKSSQELMPPPPPPQFVNFSTASGKTISVSQKAMEDAKKKFDFDDFNNEGKENNVTNIGPVPCTSNVFDFGNQSCLSPEESNEIEDLTRSLLEDISASNESDWVEEFPQQKSQPANPVTEPEEKVEPEVAIQKARTSTKRRILEQYGEPPDLPNLCTPAKRGRLTKKFVPPRPADPK